MPLPPPPIVLKRYFPESTIASAWTAVGAASAHLCVDDDPTIDDDATYVKSVTNGQQVEVGFSSLVSDPGTDTGHTFYVSIRRVVGTSGTVTLEARSAGSTVATLAGLAPTTTYFEYQWTLSAAEAAGISDYSQLSLRATSVGMLGGEELRITAVSMEFLTGVETRATRSALRAAAKEPTLRARSTRVGARAIGSPPFLHARWSRAILRALAPALPEWRATKLVGRAAALPHFLHARTTLAVVRTAGPNVYGTTVTPGALPSTLLNPLPANWVEPIKLRSSWLNDVFTGRNAAEERRTLVDRPYRTLSTRISGMYLLETHDALMNMLRAGAQKQVFPLYCDASRVTSSSSGTTVNCDTTNRRFFRGARVMIHKWTSGSRPASVHYDVIRGLTSTTLTLLNGLPSTYGVGSRVMPLMEIQLTQETRASVVTDAVALVDFEVKESVGKSALLSTSYVLPGSIQTAADDNPIFTPRVEYGTGFELAAVRKGDGDQVGRDEVFDPVGDRPLRQYATKFVSRTRAEAWEVIQFFDYCRGRGRTFYIMSPESPFEVTAVTSSTVTVKATSSVQNVRDFVKFIGITRTNGVKHVSAVGSVIDNGTTFTISFTDVGALTLNELQRLTTAHLVRFSSDEIEESWTTLEYMECDLEYMEVLKEQSIVLAGLADPDPSVETTPETISTLTLLLEVPINLYNLIPGTSSQDRSLGVVQNSGQAAGLWDDSRVPIGSVSDPGATGSSAATFFTNTYHNCGVLTRYSDPLVNLGRPALSLMQPTLNSDSGGSLTWLLNSGFFDAALGFTYVVHMQFPDVDLWNANYGFLRQDGVLECTKTQVKPYTTLDVNNTANNINTLPNLNTRRAHIVVITWSPGAYLKFIHDGFVGGVGPTTAPASLPVNTSREIQLFGGVSDSDSLGDARKTTAISFLALYKRALSNSEINSIGNYLVGRFGGSWSNL